MALSLVIACSNAAVAAAGSAQSVTLQLVTGLDERPVGGKNVYIRSVNLTGSRVSAAVTEADGQFVIPPSLVSGCWPEWQIVVDGFVPAKVELAEVLTESDQVRSRLNLDRAVSGEGKILDDDGRPVAGAQVAMIFGEAQGDVWFSPNLLHVETTDHEGRWHCDHLPVEKGPAQLVVVHPEFATLIASASAAPVPASFRFNELKQGRSVLFLHRGKRVHGRVVDEDDKPVEGAQVLSSHYPVWTPADGSFELPVAADGILKLLIRGPYHRSQVHSIGRGGDEAGLRIVLPTGKLRLGVLRDNAARPVANALVRITDDLHTSVELQRTASNGEFEVGDDDLKVSVFKPGFQLVANREVNAGSSAVEMNLTPLLELSASVVDQETGKPVPDCVVVPGVVVNGDTQWLTDRKVVVRDGRLRVRFQPDAQAIRLAIEAEDYYEHVIPPVSPAEWDAMTPIRLQRRKTIFGTIHRPEGSMAVGARIAAVPQGGKLVVGRAGSLDVPSAWFVHADSTGKFALSPPAPVAFLVASDPAVGFGLLAASNASAPVALTLEAWGEVGGVVMSNGRPAPGQLVALATESRNPIGLAVNAFVQRADSMGHFHFESVPPVPMRIGKYDAGMSHSEPVKVVPGGRVDVSFPEKGWHVHGQVVWQGTALDWSGGSHLALIRSVPTDKKEEPTVYRMTLSPDGEFSVDDIPAGTFELLIHFHEPSADGSGRLDDKYRFTTNLTLTAVSEGATDLTREIGILELQPGPQPTNAKGDQP